MQKGFRRFCVTLSIILAVYFTWANAGRKAPAYNIQLHIDSTHTIFTDAGKGNIVGINPYMIPEDYASRQHFFNKLDGYLQIALQKGWLKRNTVVLFPEYTAKWLVIESEKQSIYTAATTGKAMATFVSSNFFSYMRSWFTAPDGTMDKIRYSIFSSKGKTVAKIYVEVFSELSKKYGITIVGSSVLLPNPKIVKNRIEVNKGPLYNTTAVFLPDGTLARDLIFKNFPSAEEEPYTSGSSPEKNPVFDLSIGKSIVLIGTDSWHSQSYTTANQKDANIFLNPFYLPRDHGFSEKWNGFEGKLNPSGTLRGDEDSISVRQAWAKYGMFSKIDTDSGRTILSAGLRGRFWETGSDGEYIAVTQHTVHSGNYVSGASMVCLWLN